MGDKYPIIWTTLPSERVDIETGELLTKWQAERKNEAGKTHYIKHKTTKNVQLNEIKTRGTIKHTIEYRQRPQLTIQY